MITDARFTDIEGNHTSETLSAPVSVEFQIYNEDPRNTRLRYTDTNDQDWNEIERLELDTPGNNPRIRFLWRKENTELIEGSKTPSPEKDHGTDNRGRKYTEYTLPVPRDKHAVFEFAFKGGLPGFHLTVKVKRK